MYFNASPIDISKLNDKLLEYVEEKNQTKVFFKADQEGEYGKVVNVIKIIRDSGIEMVGIITDKKTKSSD